MSGRGKIKTELVFGIFLLSFLALTISFLATFKILERQRIEVETFNLQRIYHDLNKAMPARLSDIQLLLPSGTYYGIYDTASKTLVAGRSLVAAERIRGDAPETFVGSEFIYPQVTLAQPFSAGGRSYLLVLTKDFDAEKNLVLKGVLTFTPFALVCLFGLTGFSFMFYRKRLLDPFEGLKKAYEETGGTRFDRRIGAVNIKEWDQLYEQFNRMMDRIDDYRTGLESSIGELSRTNDALRAAQEEIVFSEKMATVGRLAAGLAHEIGNPLTSIMGYLSYMLTTAEREEDRKMLTIVLQETERISRIIRDLLNFARARAEEGTLSGCNPRDVVEDTLRLLAPQKDVKNVTLVNKAVHTRAVHFSPEELKQVLINLLINAIDVTPPGGTITISSREEEGSIRLSIADEGGGVPETVKDKIFEPFFTTKPPGRGTGLGLSVVHTLVEKYHGRVFFENTGGGAVFHLKLSTIGG